MELMQNQKMELMQNQKNISTRENISTRKRCRKNISTKENISTRERCRELVEKDDDDSITSSNIYRYKFTDEFISELFKFAKIHQYDDRHTFKEYWSKWLEDNDELVSDECSRLEELGYHGNVIDKMFKSARYYFRKKVIEKKEPTKRRNYVGVDKTMLEAMDSHIKSTKLKPSDGFDDFCKNHIDLLKIEVVKLCKLNITDPNEIKLKIKKTYKNRHFVVSNSSK